jgi:non-ribosomal peptide synthetase component F
VYLEDAQATLVVAHTTLQQRAKALVDDGCQVLDIAAALRSDQLTVAGGHSSGENAAYVIFTSGSTGRPKGVLVPHVALMDHLQGTAEFFGMGPSDSSLLTITINFDPHIMQALSPLAVGGRLVIAKPEGHADGDYVTRVLSQQAVTHFVSTPSLALGQFLGADASRCTALLCLMFGGEQLSMEVIRMMADKVRHRPLCCLVIVIPL